MGYGYIFLNKSYPCTSDSKAQTCKKLERQFRQTVDRVRKSRTINSNDNNNITSNIILFKKANPSQHKRYQKPYSLRRYKVLVNNKFKQIYNQDNVLFHSMAKTA